MTIYKLDYEADIITESVNINQVSPNEPSFGKHILEKELPFNIKNSHLYADGQVRDDTYLINNNVKHINIDGGFLIANNTIGLTGDAAIFFNANEGERVPGIQLNDTNYFNFSVENICSYILRRSNGDIGVQREFTRRLDYKPGALNEYEYYVTNIFNGTRDSYHAIFNRVIFPYSYLEDSKKTFLDTDFTNAWFDVNSLMQAHDLNIEEFYNYCEFIDHKRLPLEKLGLTEKKFNIELKYFPIYKHFALIAEYANGVREQVKLQHTDVDENNGILAISSSVITKHRNHTFLGFHVFYAACPAVFTNYSLNNRQFNFLSLDRKRINKIGLNPISDIRDRVFEPSFIQKNRLYIKKGIPSETQSDETFILPFVSGDTFLETSNDVIVNGRNIYKNQQNVFSDSGEINKITVRPTNFFEGLVENISFSTGIGHIDYPKELLSDSMAVFAEFDLPDGGTRRAILGWTNNNPDYPGHYGYSNWDTYGISGYGSGPSGFGLNDFNYGTNVFYWDTTPQPTTNYKNLWFTKAVKYIDAPMPNQVFLPTWAIPGTIEIFEYTNSEIGNQFTDFIFLEPDVIIPDKTKINLSGKYFIRYEQFNLPYIGDIKFEENRFNVIINPDYRGDFCLNLESPYNSFNGNLYLMANKEFHLDIGRWDPQTGDKTYFTNSRVDVTQIIDKKFLLLYTYRNVY